MRRRAASALLPVLLPALFWLSAPVFAAAPAVAPKEAPAKAQPDRATELSEREKALKAEEERLVSLRKEVEEKIAKYEKLLAEAEGREKRRQDEEDAKADHLVKLFEGMPPEGAAVRLEALDDKMAATILEKMKGRKASNVLAVMDPKRAAALVRRMAGGVKKFPQE
jgi:flagellar motility protein MotE (MotC chaperone)